jgi:Na+/H+ antiporter NhaC
MDNETLFYTCGIVLAVSAVAFTFLGLKAEKFPGRAAPLVVIWFAVLVGGATTFSVLHAKDEEKHEEAALHEAGEEAEEIEEEAAEAAPEH